MTQSSAPSRILHLIAPAAAGGAESVVRGLARASAARGLKTIIAALLQTEAPSPFVEQLRQDGADVREIRLGRRRYWKEVAETTRLVRQWRADLVHTHVYHADLVGYLAARRCRVPVVATVHGFTGGDAKNRFYEWADQRLLRRFDGVICVSDTVRDRLGRSGGRNERLHLIPNGYGGTSPLARNAARSRLGLDPGGRIIGWVGRLSAEKGPDLFLEALAGMNLPGTQAVMLGEGPERESLERRVVRLGLERTVTLPGSRDNAAALMPAFDVLVLSSRTEGTPMALLEAMSAGVPIVAFAVGGIPRVLDATSGWLVPPGDIAGLRSTIANVIADPAEAARRTARAAEILRADHGIEQWIGRIHRVYLAAAGVGAH